MLVGCWPDYSLTNDLSDFILPREKKAKESSSLSNGYESFEELASYRIAPRFCDFLLSFYILTSPGE